MDNPYDIVPDEERADIDAAIIIIQDKKREIFDALEKLPMSILSPYRQIYQWFEMNDPETSTITINNWPKKSVGISHHADTNHLMNCSCGLYTEQYGSLVGFPENAHSQR